MRQPKQASNFLDNATPEQLLQAVASNHRVWFERNARIVGGETRHDHGITVIRNPGVDREATIAFPDLNTRQADTYLDTVIRDCYTLDGIDQVGVWALREQTSPPDLGIRLVARGFEQGWQPYWMWLDLRRMDAPPIPTSLRVELIQNEADVHADDLPYYDSRIAQQLQAVSRIRPRRVWHFVAWLGDQPVGQSVLHLTTGRRGVAGIFNVSVAPNSRGRGVGKAVTVAALRFAHDQGCHYALLNATDMGKPLYRSLGFNALGYGQTWWLHQAVIVQGPPTPQAVALAEAAGRGDITSLDTSIRHLAHSDLDAALRCGLTPVQLAVQYGQSQAVERLVEHGATLDIISAWTLGWKERVVKILAADPDMANRTSGRQQVTPLHTAVLQDDAELVRTILSANPNLQITDAEFQSTALGWASHLGRTRLVQLINQHAGT